MEQFFRGGTIVRPWGDQGRGPTGAYVNVALTFGLVVGIVWEDYGLCHEGGLVFGPLTSVQRVFGLVCYFDTGYHRGYNFGSTCV